MRFLIKLAIIGLVVFIFVKFTKIGKDQFAYVMNITGTVVTQQEVSALCRMIYAEFVVNEERFPNRSDALWTEYIRSRMQTNARGRDKGQDIWQTAYRVQVFKEVHGRGGQTGFSVISAGPDREFGTGDDISASATFQ